jgi:hypothetical protein
VDEISIWDALGIPRDGSGTDAPPSSSLHFVRQPPIFTGGIPRFMGGDVVDGRASVPRGAGTVLLKVLRLALVASYGAREGLDRVAGMWETGSRSWAGGVGGTRY